MRFFFEVVDVETYFLNQKAIVWKTFCCIHYVQWLVFAFTAAFTIVTESYNYRINYSPDIKLFYVHRIAFEYTFLYCQLHIRDMIVVRNCATVESLLAELDDTIYSRSSQ